MIYKWDVTLPELSGNSPRKAYLYLPERYEEEPERRYPVMYMFDGHNVFFDRDAAFGKSWGMTRYMMETGTPLIIAAVECNQHGGRLAEYSPFDHESGTLGAVRGRGRLYMEWLTKSFKPMIDRHVRTLPNRADTIICGSSMGGLMALYAAAEYGHVFQKAVCLSPSLWISPERVMEMLGEANISADLQIYMDYGSEEIYNHAANAEALLDAAQLLRRRRVDLTFRITPGGSHSEASWEKQIPVFMKTLGF